jgi:hypothetical protein
VADAPGATTGDVLREIGFDDAFIARCCESGAL